MAVLSYDRPSDYDLSYLSRESGVQPLHFVMELTVEGTVGVAEVRDHLLARMAAVPALGRTLRAPLLAGRPVWVDDPAFDIARHVVEAPPGDRDADLVRDLATPLTRGHPLWRITVSPGNGTTTVRMAVQHAQMDGGLLAATLETLFSADAPSVGSWSPRPGPSRPRLTAMRLKASLARRRSPAAARVERSPGPVSGERVLRGFRLDLDRLAPLRERTGATLNDLYLCAVARALARYQEQPHDTLVVVPRDVRRPEEAGRVGNRHVALVVRLPVTADDPAQALAAVHEQVAEKKQATRTVGNDERRDVEIVCTNVRWRGQHVLAGHRVLAYRAGVPLQESTIAVVALSYDGVLAVDVTADAQAHPHLERFTAALEQAFEELVAEL